jgi:hypothetical protein
VENYRRSVQATDDNMAHAHCMLDNYGYKHTLGICNKAVPLQAWSGAEGSRKLMFPDFVTTAQEGSEVVSLTHRPHLPPGNSSGTHLCWETAVAQWLRCCATNRKVAGSFPDGVIGVFH